MLRTRTLAQRTNTTSTELQTHGKHVGLGYYSGLLEHAPDKLGKSSQFAGELQ